MNNILNEIMAKRKQTVSQLKQIVPMEAWEMMPDYSKRTISLKKILENESSTGIGQGIIGPKLQSLCTAAWSRSK